MSDIKIGGIYTHYKKLEQKYKIIGIAFNTETEEDMVIYQPQYENEHAYFVRPLRMFLEEVEFEGKKVPRFQLQN